MLHVSVFNPEWGYLAPAPSLVRTVRLVVAAAVVGATASAAVVFALARQPAAEGSVAARTLVQRVETAAVWQTPLPAELPAQAQHASTANTQHAPGSTRRQSAPAVARADPFGANDSAAASTTQRASIAGLAETPATTAKAATAKVPLASTASGIAPAVASDAARASKTPNKKSTSRAKDQQAKDAAAGPSRLRVAMAAQHPNKPALQPPANNVLRNNVVPDNNNDVRDDDSLLGRTMGVTDDVIAATHRAVSTIGVIPSWIGSIGNRIGG